MVKRGQCIDFMSRRNLSVTSMCRRLPGLTAMRIWLSHELYIEKSPRQRPIPENLTTNNSAGTEYFQRATAQQVRPSTASSRPTCGARKGLTVSDRTTPGPGTATGPGGQIRRQFFKVVECWTTAIINARLFMDAWTCGSFQPYPEHAASTRFYPPSSSCTLRIGRCAPSAVDG